MTTWDLHRDDDLLIVKRTDEDRVYILTQTVKTAFQLAFWLRHYERLETSYWKLICDKIALWRVDDSGQLTNEGADKP